MEHERGPYYRPKQRLVSRSKVNRFVLPPDNRHLIEVPVRASLQPASQHPQPTVYRPAIVEEPARPALYLNMNLPGAPEQPGHRLPTIARLPQSRTKRVVKRGSLTALALLLVIGGSLGWQAYTKLHHAFTGTGETVAALQTAPDAVDPNALKGEGSGRINILLLGKGGFNHPGGDLTDTMLLASIDPVNKTVALLSIPRDMWVTVPGGGSMKINAVYTTAKAKALRANPKDPTAAEAAGISSVEQMVTTVIGVPVNYYAMLDFTVFKDAVDAVNGITINVPQELFDPTMAWENNNNPVLARQGTQHMNGAQALLYVRSRETSSDFARTERQRAVITTLEQTALSASTLTNPLKLSGLISAFGDHFSTDLSIANAERLVSLLKGVDLNAVQSIGLTDATNDYVRTDRVGDQSVVRPLAGFNNYAAINSFVRNALKDGYLAQENAGILVLNGSATDPQAANKMATELQSYGYRVVGTGQLTTIYPKTAIIDLTQGQARYTRHYLEARLKTTAITNLPDATIKPNGAQFVIIVGNE